MSQNPIYLTLDRRSNRIRITNGMLAYIGMPKYLQFLINTDERMMIVRAMDKGIATEQTYKVKYQPSKEKRLQPILMYIRSIQLTPTGVAGILGGNFACI